MATQVLVPNLEDAPSFDAQAVPDKQDMLAVQNGVSGTGTVSGGAVSAPGGTRTVQVTAWSGLVGGIPVTMAGPVSGANSIALPTYPGTDTKHAVVVAEQPTLAATYLHAGGAVTSLTVLAVPVAIPSGSTLVMPNGDVVVTSSLTNAGVTSIAITSFTPAAGAGWVSGQLLTPLWIIVGTASGTSGWSRSTSNPLTTNPPPIKPVVPTGTCLLAEIIDVGANVSSANLMDKRAPVSLGQATVVVAASNSLPLWQFRANYVCTGTSSNPVDHTTLSTAATAAAGGVLMIVGGDYYLGLNVPILANTQVIGAGRNATLLHPNWYVQQVCNFSGTSVTLHAGGNFPSTIVAGMNLTDVTTGGNIPANTHVVSGAGTATLTVNNTLTTQSTGDTVDFMGTFPMLDIYDQTNFGTAATSNCSVRDIGFVYLQSTSARKHAINTTVSGQSRFTAGTGIGVYVNGDHNIVEDCYFNAIQEGVFISCFNRQSGWLTTTSDGVSLGGTTTASVTLTNGSTSATVASGGFPGVFAGMPIIGPYIPVGATVSSVSGNTLTLSTAAIGPGASGITLTTTATLNFTGSFTVGSATQGWTSNNIGDFVRMAGAGNWSDPGQAANALAACITAVASPTVANCTANGTGTVTSTNNFGTAGVLPGMAVTGTGVPAGTCVQAVSGTTITVSNNVTTGSPLLLSFFGATLDVAATASVSAATTDTMRSSPFLGRCLGVVVRNLDCVNCWVGVGGAHGAEQVHVDGVHGSFIETVFSGGSATPAHACYFDGSHGNEFLDFSINDMVQSIPQGTTSAGSAVKVGCLVGGRITNCSASYSANVVTMEGPLRHVTFDNMTGHQLTSNGLEMFGYELFCTFSNFTLDYASSITTSNGCELGGSYNIFRNFIAKTNFASNFAAAIFLDQGSFNHISGITAYAMGPGRMMGMQLYGMGGHQITDVKGTHLSTLIAGTSNNLVGSSVDFDPGASYDVTAGPLCGVNTAAAAYPEYTPVDQVTLTQVTGAGTVTPDQTATYTQVLNFTTTGAVTIANPANLAQGNRLRLVIQNNSGGNLAITWGSCYAFTTPWLSPYSGDTAVIEFVCPSDNLGGVTGGSFVEVVRNAKAPTPALDFSPTQLPGTAEWRTLDPVCGPFAGSGVALTTGQMFAEPFFVAQDCTLVGLCADVTAAGTSAVVAFGLSNDDGTGVSPMVPVTVASCTVTSGSKVVTVASGGFPGVRPGHIVNDSTTSAHITAGTTVVSIVGNTMTLSQNAAGSGTDTLSFGGVYTLGSQTVAGTGGLVQAGSCPLKRGWYWAHIVQISATGACSVSVANYGRANITNTTATPTHNQIVAAQLNAYTQNSVTSTPLASWAAAHSGPVSQSPALLVKLQ